jgi:hypothetical protein
MSSKPANFMDSIIAHQLQYEYDDNFNMDNLTNKIIKQQQNEEQKKKAEQKKKEINERKRQNNLKNRYNNKYERFTFNHKNSLNINNNNNFIDNYLRISNMSYEELLNLENKIGNVNRGLNQQEINNLGEEIYNSDLKLNDSTTQCIICLSNFKIGEKIRYLKCNHFFHKDCIDNWLQLQKKCPTCNQEIK